MSQNLKLKWLEKKSSSIALNQNTRITIAIEKTGSPRYLNEEDITMEEKANIFANKFVELLEDDLTPRQIKALIQKLEKQLK